VGLAHVFWLCPQIQGFCKHVVTMITKVLGFNVDTTLKLYLGNSPEGSSKDDEYIDYHKLLASTKHSFGAFVGIFKHLYLPEQMTYSSGLQN